MQHVSLLATQVVDQALVEEARALVPTEFEREFDQDISKKRYSESLLKAFIKPSSITLFLLNSILKGFEISTLLISKALASTLLVEKKNNNENINIKKINIVL